MRKKLYIAAIVFFALLFVISAFLLIRYYVQIDRSEKAYKELAQIKQNALVQAEEKAPVSENGEKQEAAFVEVTDKNGEPMLVLPEYAPIYELNQDTVGWIKIEGTKVDYPVVQRKDSTDYYLNRDFYGQWSSQGTIYAREQCDVFAPSDNITLYGHLMKVNTMFGDLSEYKSKAFWQDHQYIQFDTLTEHHTYQVFAVFTIESSEDSDFQYHLFVNAQEDAQFEQFVKNAKRYSLYDTGISAAAGDKLITLSTCDGNGNLGRLVVVAKRVTE